ncbi:MAG: glycosyl transferase [Clostridia bacterium]|nr:glycosyl transferase [Clostridia bacterium]
MKHAYLIIAHNNFYILEKLIRLLDDSRNDIFIHIDKKVKNFDFKKFALLAKNANVIFTKKRINVKWGGNSQVKTEINLFETACKINPDGYKYYHLISGVDLPIKTQDYIHNFFEYKEENFIYYKDDISVFDEQRISRFRIKIANKRLRNYFYILQAKLKIDRMKNSKYEIKKGYNWASLTHDAIKIILKSKKDIYKFTSYSICADEMYKQMVLHHNNVDIYKDSQGNTCDLRLVDWKRGNGNNPYVFRSEDFDMLTESDRLFARKFDTETDKAIIDKIYEYVMKQSEKEL